MARLSAIYAPGVGILRHTCATGQNARAMLGDMLANGELEPGASVVRLPRGGACPSCGGEHPWLGRNCGRRRRSLPTRWAGQQAARRGWGGGTSYVRNAAPCVGGEGP
jgi:hypothetical protein